MNPKELNESIGGAVSHAWGDGFCSDAEEKDLRDKLTELCRRDWAVRVLDVWALNHALTATPFRAYPPQLASFSVAPAHWLCRSDFDGGHHSFYSADPDAARLAAADAVYPELPAEARAQLGERP